MKKIIVIGCSGSGKSTFARKLSALVNIPLYYLDMLWYKSDKTTLLREDFDEKLRNLMRKSEWIIDGNYQRTLEMRLKECDTVFLLDIPTDICLEGAISKKGKKRVDLPWLETEFEEGFRQWICDYSNKVLPKIYELLDKYRQGRQIYIFKTRNETDQYLQSLATASSVADK